MEPVAQATDDDGLICAASVTQNRPKLNHAAQSSEEALQMVRTTPPDLLFLDVVLPGQSGFEFCRDLKTDESTRNIPIVICSTKGTEADKLWGSMLGADAYLTKPVDQQQIAQTVQQLVP